MKNSTVFMPMKYYEEIADLVFEGKYSSRSEFIRIAVKRLLEKEGKL